MIVFAAELLAAPLLAGASWIVAVLLSTVILIIAIVVAGLSLSRARANDACIAGFLSMRQKIAFEQGVEPWRIHPNFDDAEASKLPDA